MAVKSRRQELEAADHIDSTVRKQGLGGRGGAEHCILGPRPVEWCCPHLVCVCPLQLTLSRNFLTDVLKGLSGDFRPCLLPVNINCHINLVYASLLLTHLNCREFFRIFVVYWQLHTCIYDVSCSHPPSILLSNCPQHFSCLFQVLLVLVCLKTAHWILVLSS